MINGVIDKCTDENHWLVAALFSVFLLSVAEVLLYLPLLLCMSIYLYYSDCDCIVIY